MKKIYFDLNEPIFSSTYLTVKYGMKWVHYNIPRLKKNGEPRTYGELYHFYTQKPDFKMAMGYLRGEDGDFWFATHRYFYFDKNEFPLMSEMVLKNRLILPKTVYQAR